MDKFHTTNFNLKSDRSVISKTELFCEMRISRCVRNVRENALGNAREKYARVTSRRFLWP